MRDQESVATWESTDFITIADNSITTMVEVDIRIDGKDNIILLIMIVCVKYHGFMENTLLPSIFKRF